MVPETCWSSDFERTVAPEPCWSSAFERTLAPEPCWRSDFERTETPETVCSSFLEFSRGPAGHEAGKKTLPALDLAREFRYRYTLVYFSSVKAQLRRGSSKIGVRSLALGVGPHKKKISKIADAI